MKNSFVFYRSFYEAIEDLDDATQLEIYKAIAAYSLNGEVPDLSGFSKTVFTLVKPQLDANNKRYENGKKGAEHGKKGGRPRKEQAEKPVQEKSPQNIDMFEDSKVVENKTQSAPKNGNAYSDDFLEFWQHYPKNNGSKKTASQSYTKAIKRGADHLTIMQGVYAYANFITGNEKFTKHASTWLNNDCWETQYSKPQSTAAANAGHSNKRAVLDDAFRNVFGSGGGENSAPDTLCGEQQATIWDHP